MISVIISTRDRADKLCACLESIAVAAPGFTTPIEVVLVDNGSRDRTPSVASSFTTRLPLRYTTEERPGLSYGRNRGIVEARGDIIVFLDDDCLVAPDWLHVVAQEFEDPTLDACGGRVELNDPEDAPVGIRTSPVREPVKTVYQLFGGLPGCNLAVRRRVLDRVGHFDLHLGAGSPTGSGEDTDFIYRMMLGGHYLLYVPTMVVYHDHGRRGQAVEELNCNYVRGRGAFYCKHILRGSRPIFRLAARETVDLALEALRLAPQRRIAPRAGKRLRQLAAGAAMYLNNRRRALGPSPTNN
jgi:glycosyltransferase involved in cell wall biosynthesis